MMNRANRKRNYDYKRSNQRRDYENRLGEKYRGFYPKHEQEISLRSTECSVYNFGYFKSTKIKKRNRNNEKRSNYSRHEADKYDMDFNTVNNAVDFHAYSHGRGSENREHSKSKTPEVVDLSSDDENGNEDLNVRADKDVINGFDQRDDVVPVNPNNDQGIVNESGRSNNVEFIDVETVCNAPIETGEGLLEDISNDEPTFSKNSKSDDE